MSGRGLYVRGRSVFGRERAMKEDVKNDMKKREYNSQSRAVTSFKMFPGHLCVRDCQVSRYVTLVNERVHLHVG